MLDKDDLSGASKLHVHRWHVDYFELKAMLASGSRETSAPPFNYLKERE